MRWFLVFLAFMVPLAGSTAVAAASASADAAHQRLAAQLERDGSLRAAYVELGKIKAPTKAQTTHRAHVAAAVQAVAAAAALQRAKDPAGAQATLDAARGKLDIDADRNVIVALARRSAAVAAAARVPADRQARAAIRKGDALVDQEHWAQAAEIYESVATKPAGSVSPELAQQATVKQLAAEQKAVEEEPSPTADFFTSVWHTLRDGLQWLLLATLLVAVWLALMGIRAYRRARPVSEQTSLLLVDATADGKDQEAQNLALRNEFADAVQEVRYSSLGVEGADVDERRDLDGTAAPAMVRPSDDGELDALVKDVQLSVGAVKVKPFQLMAFWRWIWERPTEHQITGTLRADGKGTEICLDLGRNHWSAGRVDEDARAAVIRDAAQKYVVESGYSYITTSWRSFAAYTDGLDALARASKATPEEREAALDGARALLERAVCQDGGNLPARLRLAAVLGALGRNGEAAAQFARLMEDLRRPGRVPSTAKDFVKRHPELFWVAAINCAITLGKATDGRRYSVLRDLAVLVAALGPDGTEPPVLDTDELADLKERLATREYPDVRPDALDRRRLYIVVLSAWAAQLAITVDRSDKGLSPEQLERLKSRRIRVAARLREVKSELAEVSGSDLSAAGGQADAVLENALARVELRRGRSENAREAAERALALNPDLGDAHVTLAKIAMADEEGDDWSDEAERHLRAALALSPNDRRARRELGRLYRKIGDPTAAKEVLQVKAMRTDWRALELLGEIALDGDDYAGAIPYLVRSQGRNPSGDYRAERLVQAVFDLRNVDGATLLKVQGNAAMDAADRLIKAIPKDPEHEAKRDAAVGRKALLGEVVDELTARRVDPPPHDEQPVPPKVSA
ncbi:tetratricopeptide repeat protein [Baekduia sp. Peel2402]|uniref:tetratricopeptide repeat protein n=1 Tax=Baekduia sp. Peel2402 TaxID=3458296 RepID=UPI00403E5AAD